MTQRTYLKTSMGQMFVKHLNVVLPDGGEFIIDQRLGAMYYKGRTFEKFEDAIGYNGLTAQDLEVIKALAVALCDQSKLLKQIKAFN